MEHHEFGLFAMHLATGFIAPLSDYLPEAHQGCTYLFGLIAAPVLGIGGPTVGSLRVASLILHAATAAIFAVLGHRVGGLRAGLVTGALMVAAPPMMVHFAHKGSTNHDDADLFVGLVLLLLIVPGSRAARSGLRACLLGLLVGVAGVYLLDGAVRALAAIGVCSLMTGRPSKKQVLGFGTTLLMVVVLSWAVGIRMGPTTSVGHAILDTPIVPTLDRQGDAKPRMTARIVDLFDVAIPEGFRGGYPLPFEWETMPEWVRGWSYPVGLLLLIFIASLGRKQAARGPPEQWELRLLLERSCWAVIVVQIVAVLVSSLDVASDYIVPVWPYLVLLAALAFVPCAGDSRWMARVRLLTASVIVVLPLSIGGAAVWQDVRSFYSPPFGERTGNEAVSAQQAAFAQSLVAGRLGNHVRGYRLVMERDDERLLRLAANRPSEAVSFARLRGRAGANHLVDEACRLMSRRGFAALEPGLGTAQRLVFWEGVGEGLTRWPEPCTPLVLRQLSDLDPASDRMPAGNDPILSGSSSLAHIVRELSELPSPESDAFLMGLAEGLLDEREAEFEGLELAFPEGRERRAFCLAAGRWAYNWLRPVELTDWLEVSAACTSTEVAVGWGIGMARDVAPGAESGVRPNYRWWWTDPSAEEVAAFECSWERGREELDAMLNDQPAPSPGWRDCLPALEPTAEAPEAGGGSDEL